ncbi:hypothetical protein C7974DRAFT_352574 [Boeremia exigua]|uniref:uncharacterized protein n=1 Tax=Boeremia exigua TaxID=749465 RepID=UPI001E8CDB5F|nr:uncharacterized protein C7974DRAFT_352574 [Boeremia exigua]KAH6643231.1 hypothetical protein C7974DRAFT_352574 [Boeremia exigua]
MSLSQSIRVNKPPTLISRTLSGLSHVASEPIVTGGLLYLLTQGPAKLRGQILAPFQTSLPIFTNDPKGVAKLAALVTALKVLTTAGVLRRLHEAINRLAWNNWTFGRAGTEWQFGPDKKETILITGASSGFGYLMAKELSKHARIIALNRSPLPADLAALKDVHYYKCDVGDISALEAVCDQVKQDFGTISVLINNAGYGIGKTILETTNAEDEMLLRVNLLSNMVLIRAFVPGMLAQRKGHVVSVASMGSFVVPPLMVNYCITKIGQLYLTEGLRAECLTRYPGGSSICTTSIHPGWHETGIDKDGILEEFGIVNDPPQPVIDAVLDQVLKGKSGMICIPKHHTSDSLLRFLPRWVQDLKFGLVSTKL